MDESKHKGYEEEDKLYIQAVFAQYNQFKHIEIKDALAAGDTQTARNLVHSLRGTAGQIGKIGLYEIAGKVENLLASENDSVPQDDLDLLERELLSAIDEFMPLIGSIDHSPVETNFFEPPNKKRTSGVLIIDDNASSIRMLSSILKSEHTLYAVTDGAEAVKTAIKFMPDVILLDVLMHGKDGFYVMGELKNNAKTMNIPVIFISGLDGVDAEVKGLELGAADYITKPYSPAVVKLRVRNQIKISGLKREMKNDFLRSIGHELKTSLTRIHTDVNNALDLFDFGMDKDEMQESLKSAGKEIMRLAGIINNEINSIAEEEEADV